MFRSIILCVMLLCFCGVATFALAQPPDTLWTRTYGVNSWGGFCVQQTLDGGFIIAGSTTSPGRYAFLINTDVNGNENWFRTFGSNYNNGAYSVKQTSDGGYIAVGYTMQYDSEQVFLIKTDSNGNEIWHQNLGGYHFRIGYDVEQTSDGGYIIVGTNQDVGYWFTQILLIKTNAMGGQSWERIFYGYDPSGGYCVKQVSDGGYIITGYCNSPPNDMQICLIKTDSNGNETWFRTFGGLGQDQGISFDVTADGGYIILGKTNSFEDDSIYLIKTDWNGNELWHRTLGDGVLDGSCIQQTSDGGYIITGSRVFGANLYNALLIKTDAEGDTNWTQTYSTGANDRNIGYYVQQTSDDGFVITGWTDNNGGSCYLIKTNSEFPPPTMQVTIAPVSPPIIIPANGGWFFYNINARNYGDSTQTFNVWNRFKLPNGTMSDPVMGPVTRTFPANYHPTRTYMQTVAGSMPSGNYLYLSYVGAYPWVISDSSYFPFTKTALSDGGEWIAETTCSGDFFDEFVVADGGTRFVASNRSEEDMTKHVPPNISPNPFNPTTILSYELRDASFVTLKVYDTAGRLVQTLVDGWREAGSHEVTFDGSDLSSGIYIYRLTMSGSGTTPTTRSGKMVLLK